MPIALTYIGTCYEQNLPDNPTEYAIGSNFSIYQFILQVCVSCLLYVPHLINSWGKNYLSIPPPIKQNRQLNAVIES